MPPFVESSTNKCRMGAGVFREVSELLSLPEHMARSRRHSIVEQNAISFVFTVNISWSARKIVSPELVEQSAEAKAWRWSCSWLGGRGLRNPGTPSPDVTLKSSAIACNKTRNIPFIFPFLIHIDIVAHFSPSLCICAFGNTPFLNT